MAAVVTPTAKMGFAEVEMAVDEGLGFPKAYAKICKNPSVINPYAQGPPFAFLPYTLQPQEALRAKDLSQMFPIVDPEAIPSVNPRGFANLLWKQLDHLGNAGFDPALFRVDPYGNVLYLHADSASPLGWDIDHWFPCSRGGRTVPSNLRLLQWQVCKKKHNKLEFLIPWWDLQLGISVNQFLSIFASKYSDFRSRAFSFLFCNGGSEELTTLQAVEAHVFPQHFVDMEQQIGLGPAAIVSSRRVSDASVLRPLDANRSLSHNYHLNAARKFIRGEDDVYTAATPNSRSHISKENNHPHMENCDSNLYLSIAMARDSLRQREETKKKQAEINRLEDELNELKQNNEDGRIVLQELEALLIKRRRRVEKSRRLAEAQSSYKALLEKMIRDAMHQAVVYKEQVRQNQGATGALMARLEAQRAMCDSSENELRRKYKQRDEIEKQIRPAWELRKRSRVDVTLLEEGLDERLRLSCTRRTNNSLKELRIFLEEEQKASKAGLSIGEGEDEETTEETLASDSSQKGGSYSDDWTDNEELKDLAIRRKTNSSSVKLKENYVPPTEKNGKGEESGSVINEKLEQLAIRDKHLSRTIEPKKQSSSCLGLQEEASDGYDTPGARKDITLLTDRPRKIETEERCFVKPPVLRIKIPNPQIPCKEDCEQYLNQNRKGKAKMWPESQSEGFGQGPSSVPPQRKPNSPEYVLDGTVQRMNSVPPPKEIKLLRLKPLEEKVGAHRTPIFEQSGDDSYSKSRYSEDIGVSINMVKKNNDVEGVYNSATGDVIGSRKSFEVKDPRSESSRGFRSLPSSPSMISGMRRDMDYSGKKPKSLSDDHNGKDNIESTNKFIKSCTKAIKRVINI